MDTVRVGSYETKLELICTERLVGGEAALIRARILAPGLDAARDAYEHGGYAALAAFFEAMADSWRGWTGQRSFSSLEGDLELAAAHDGRHVELSVRLRHHESGEWSASATVVVDPGEDLAAAARAVRELVDRSEPPRPLDHWRPAGVPRPPEGG